MDCKVYLQQHGKKSSDAGALPWECLDLKNVRGKPSPSVVSTGLKYGAQAPGFILYVYPAYSPGRSLANPYKVATYKGMP